jgi:hypothetical protein
MKHTSLKMVLRWPATGLAGRSPQRRPPRVPRAPDIGMNRCRRPGGWVGGYAQPQGGQIWAGDLGRGLTWRRPPPPLRPASRRSRVRHHAFGLQSHYRGAGAGPGLCELRNGLRNQAPPP